MWSRQQRLWGEFTYVTDFFVFIADKTLEREVREKQTAGAGADGTN